MNDRERYTAVMNFQKLDHPPIVRALRIFVPGMFAIMVCTQAFAWKYNPPEFYSNIREIRKQRIEQQREKIDLNEIPRYRTVIKDVTDSVIIEKETYTFWISKSNGSINRAKILDVDLNSEFKLANLEFVDSTGQIFSQEYSRNGKASVKDEKFHLYVTHRFIPYTRDGTPASASLEVLYDLYKMSGLLTVRYKVVSGETHVNKVTIRNTVGKTPKPLDFVNTCYYFDNNDIQRPSTEAEITENEDKIHYAGRIPYAYWTDGRIGFEAMPLRYTYEQFDIDLETSGEKRMTVSTISGCRHIDFTFINKKQPRTLRVGDSFEFALAFMPMRKFEPMFGMPGSFMAHNFVFDPVDERTERYFREISAAGVTDVIAMIGTLQEPLAHAVGTAGVTGSYSSTPINEQYKKIVDICHKYGIRVTTGDIVNIRLPEKLLMDEKIIPEEDLKKIQAEPWANFQVSNETPEARDYFLDCYCSHLESYPIDGVYVDLHAAFIADKNWTSQIEGNVKLVEDMRILLDSYGSGKYMILHSGFMVTPLETTGDSIYPGEPIWHLRIPNLTRGILETVYNPFLLGTSVITGNWRSYDMRSVDIYKQFYRNTVTPFLPYDGKYNMFQQGFGLKPDEKALFDRYCLPFRSFEIEKATLYHWRYPETSKYLKVENPELGLNLYTRDKEILAVGAQLDNENRSRSVSIDIRKFGFKTDEAFVFDVLANKMSIAKVGSDGWIKFNIENAEKEPVLYYVKEKNGEGPQVVWHDPNIQMVKFEDKTPSAKPGERPMLYMTWKFKVVPEDGQYQNFRLYCGELKGPIVVHPAFVERYYTDEDCIDISVHTPPLGMNGLYNFNRPYDGKASEEQEMFVGWGKNWQLGFPHSR